MEKPKKITILSLAVLGVLYGAATASATPFLTLIHDFMAFSSAKAPASSADPRNNLDPDVGSSSAAGLTFMPLTYISDSPLSLADHADNAMLTMNIASLGEQPGSNLIGQDHGEFVFHSAQQLPTSLGNLGRLELNDPQISFPYILNSFPIAPVESLPKTAKSPDRPDIADAPSEGGKPEHDEKTNEAPKANAPSDGGKPERKEAPIADAPSEGDRPLVSKDGDKSQAPPNQNVLCDVNPSAYGCIDLIGDGEKSISTVSTIHGVSEPGSLALLGLGIAGLGLIRRRRI